MMKNAGTYIASFVISVLLVFSVMAALLSLTAVNYANEDRLIQLVKDRNITFMVNSELEKYFSDKAHTTEIPAEIYMDAISEDYLDSIIESKIRGGFAVLSRSGYDAPDIANAEMEENLDSFYSDYAKKIGYKIDEKYEKKLQSSKDSAYKTIEEYCDVFKFGALSKHGVLKKVTPVYIRLGSMLGVSIVSSVILAVILLLVNLKGASAAVYWLGASSLIAGILGAAPCIYLLCTDYFSSFTIKQAQIYTAYTGTMDMATRGFLTYSVIAAVSGVLLMLIYGIVCRFSGKKKTAEK